MGLSLVAFDTDHIKSYVFGTDRLKEIRGASSLLDLLNRQGMEKVARQHKIGIITIYANGGSGLFLVDAENAKKFGHLVQQLYKQSSWGGASITFVVQDLPTDIEGVKTDDLSDELKLMLQQYPPHIQAIMTHDLKHELDLMRYHLREAKACPSGSLYDDTDALSTQSKEQKTSQTTIAALPSHPFMRACDSCGIEYAERPGEEADFYCASCRQKQLEDDHIKHRIKDRIESMLDLVDNNKDLTKEYLWDRILIELKRIGYKFRGDLSELRPNDFNEFGLFARSKKYFGLIYADANNMGTEIEKLNRLIEIEGFAKKMDDHIHKAMSLAIKKHLPIVDVEREGKSVPIFPFDILLIGGDDIVMATEATKTMDVALTIAQEFRRLAGNAHTLSIGVVLAPVKYPFGLLREIAEGALKFAKTESAKARTHHESDDTRINFLIVTGGSSSDFKDVFNTTYHRIDEAKKKKKVLDENSGEFYTTLRPYSAKNLDLLLEAIRNSKVNGLNLGHTKLHQLREAVLEKNLTTAVSDGLALLRNWRDKERSYIVQRVYEFGDLYRMPRSNPDDPVSGFPRVTFPWFVDGKNKDEQNIYRTPLLDFIELYDFVYREGEESSDEQ